MVSWLLGEDCCMAYGGIFREKDILPASIFTREFTPKIRDMPVTSILIPNDNEMPQARHYRQSFRNASPHPLQSSHESVRL
jgi:hypothetical protein